MKKTSSFILGILVFMMVILYAGCTPLAEEMSADGDAYYPVTVTDQAGNDVTVEKVPERIASGYYISTSALIALGLEDKLVGIEDKSELRPLYSMVSEDLTERCVNIGSAKAFDVEACLSSEPDIVILPKKAKDYADALKEVGIDVVIVNPEDDEKLKEMINILGEITGTGDRAEYIIEKQNQILKEVESRSEGLKDEEKPVVYMCSPDSYLSTCPVDMYQASLIRSAGGRNAGDVLDGDSRTEISYEQIIAMNPDIMIIPTNDFANGGPDYSAEDIFNDEELSNITAVKNGAVYYMPQGLEAWDSPVPSGVLGSAWLLSIIHPDLMTKEEVADMATDFYSEIYGFEIDRSIITG